MSEIPADELFHNNYHYFINRLRNLSEDAQTQCKIGQNFNVAWELQDDLLKDAFGVLSYPDSGLSAAQRASITDLIEALNAIPKSVMSGARTAEGSLKDMSHPCWAPLRKTASSLLVSLEPITERNQAYFHDNKP